MIGIETPRQLGVVVAQARRAQKLTQAQVAEAAGVSRQLVNRLEMGSADGIMFGKLIAVLKALSCSLAITQDGVDVSAAVPSTRPQGMQGAARPIDLPRSFQLDETLFVAPSEGR